MRLVVFAATLALALPATALDLAARTFDYGITEWGVSGSYLHVGDTEAHHLELELHGGKMMGGGMELEMQGSLDRRWREDECVSTFGVAGAFVHNVRTYASWVPFFLAGGGLEYDRDSDHGKTVSETDAVIHLGAGVKFFFIESAALRVEYRFRNRMADPENVYSHIVLAGMSVFLG